MKRDLIQAFCLWLSLVSAVLADDPIVKITETNPGVDINNEMIAQLSKNAELKCVVENKPTNIEVKWVMYAEGSTVPVPISSATDSSDAFKYSVDQPTPTAWRLRVLNLQVTDEGAYVCRVQVSSQTYVEDRRTLRVVESPSIADLQTSNDMTVKEGDNVQLKCNATGRPFPVIRWMRLAGELLPNGGQELRDYTLNIPQVQPQHRGVYKCLASNRAGSQERKIFLTVKFYPRVGVSAPVLKQAIGYYKDLQCYIQGYPIPVPDQIAWTRDTVPIVHGGHYTIKSIEGADNRITSTLTIKGVQQEDYGLYTCSGQNSEGENKATIGLEYSEMPTPDRTGTIRSGASVTILSVTTVLMMCVVCLLHRFE